MTEKNFAIALYRYNYSTVWIVLIFYIVNDDTLRTATQ